MWTDKQTDGLTDRDKMKLSVASCDFAKVPKKER
jgi:hypothetical protein